jgi:hypothetical protein
MYSLLLSYYFAHACHHRFSVAPKVTHTVVRNSAIPISGDEVSLSDDEPATSARNKPPATHVVSKPKHKPATQFRASTSSSLSAVGVYLEQKTAFECKHLEESKKKRAAEVRRERLEMAKVILATPGADEEMKIAAKQVLLNFLQG